MPMPTFTHIHVHVYILYHTITHTSFTSVLHVHTCTYTYMYIHVCVHTLCVPAANLDSAAFLKLVCLHSDHDSQIGRVMVWIFRVPIKAIQCNAFHMSTHTLYVYTCTCMYCKCIFTFLCSSFTFCSCKHCRCCWSVNCETQWMQCRCIYMYMDMKNTVCRVN